MDMTTLVLWAQDKGGEFIKNINIILKLHLKRGIFSLDDVHATSPGG